MTYHNGLILLAAMLSGGTFADRASGQSLALEPLPPVDAVIRPVAYDDYFDVQSAIDPQAGNPTSAPVPASAPPADPMAAGHACPPAAPCESCHCADCCCWPCECPCPLAPCLPCPRINLVNPCWNLLVGGNITLDMLYNSGRPVAPGTPFFLLPSGPFSDDTFDMHARQTTMYFAAMGPQMGSFRSGGLILFNLYNDNVIADRYGFLPYQAYGELKNETWRFAGGLQADIFAPLLPTVLPFSYLLASGNTGVFRGQFRAERYFYPATDEQITFIAGELTFRKTDYVLPPAFSNDGIGLHAQMQWKF